MNAVIESGYQICLRGLWAYRLIRVDYEKIFLHYPAVAILIIHMLGSVGNSRLIRGIIQPLHRFIFYNSWKQPFIFFISFSILFIVILSVFYSYTSGSVTATITTM